MTMDDLIEERERLLKQRMDILQAALKPVQESDLDDACRTDVARHLILQCSPHEVAAHDFSAW